MMDYEDQLKLQAFLDGELPRGRGARSGQSWLARDAEARGALDELREDARGAGRPKRRQAARNARILLVENRARDRPAGDPASEPAAKAPLGALLRLLVPAASLAVLAIVGLIAVRDYCAGRFRTNGMEVAVADSEAFTYRDFPPARPWFGCRIRPKTRLRTTTTLVPWINTRNET